MAAKPIITREIPPLPTRPEDAHKGSVGRVLVIGGCDIGACGTGITMAGAPAMAARAAFRSGAGLVQIAVPDGIRHSVGILVPNATVCSYARQPGEHGEHWLTIVEQFKADVVVVGPGLGDGIRASELAAFVMRCPVPLVLDADGLNLLAKATVGQGRVPLGQALQAEGDPQDRPCVLTPHPGEAKRLLDAWGRPPATDRQQTALTLHECTGAVIVLKGHGTIVTNGKRLYVNETGNAGMATGGTGDVLTGVIAALIGQGMETFEASVLGVHIHGLAGDFAAQDIGPISMTAEDIIAYLPDAFGEFEE
ncbi:MAG: NAD(P)H-hydrate dehydratase [Phycisphaerales bacterium]|nr:NAD(P)H-hydrate dehydratase [Phycisphaerales bacterium]